MIVFMMPNPYKKKDRRKFVNGKKQ